MGRVWPARTPTWASRTQAVDGAANSPIGARRRRVDQAGPSRFNGRRELRNIGPDGLAHDCVRCIEVAMGKLVSHRRDVAPGDLRLARKQAFVDVLNRLTDLDESGAYSVENESVGQRSTGDVLIDGGDRVEDVEQTVSIAAAQSGT